MMGGKNMTEHKFVVKLVCYLSDEPEVLIEINFATRKEAEEYRDLTLYAMKAKYGEYQTIFDFKIFEP